MKSNKFIDFSLLFRQFRSQVEYFDLNWCGSSHIENYKITDRIGTIRNPTQICSGPLQLFFRWNPTNLLIFHYFFGSLGVKLNISISIDMGQLIHSITRLLTKSGQSENQHRSVAVHYNGFFDEIHQILWFFLTFWTVLKSSWIFWSQMIRID